jgi:signal transduction histidine kinase
VLLSRSIARVTRLDRLDRLDAVLAATVVVLASFTAAVVFLPMVGGQHVEAGLDLVLDTFATVVTLGVAVVAWVRYREIGAPVALFQASAFLVLAIASGASLLFVVGKLDVALADFGLNMPREAQPQITTAGHLMAAALLVIGAAVSLKRIRPRQHWLIVLGPAAALLAIIQFASSWSHLVPPLSGVFILNNLSSLSNWPNGQPVPPSPTPLGLGLHLVVGGLFVLAAELTRRHHRRTGALGDGFLAVGLVFAAFGEFHTAFYPSTYGGLVTSGDMLTVAFAAVLLIGIEADARATRAALGRANETLGRLRDVEVRQAALEERTRLSRELHDGLAQDLWLAKLKIGRLNAMPELSHEAKAVCDELSGAIDAGLADARQAVMALRLGGEPAMSLRDLMAHYVDDFGDRFGLRAEFECEDELPRLTPRAEAELLRIAQEALNNVVRHADATVVRVRAGVADSHIELLVGDNGMGFEPSEVRDGCFGLASMRERAQIIGGELTIDSRPHDGTRIRIRVPLKTGERATGEVSQ